MRTVTFKIDESLLERLDTYVKIAGKTRSEVIREAIFEYLERHMDNDSLPWKPKIVKIRG